MNEYKISIKHVGNNKLEIYIDSKHSSREFDIHISKDGLKITAQFDDVNWWEPEKGRNTIDILQI